MDELDYECDVTCDADGCKNHYFITSSCVLTTEQVDKIGGILGWTFVGEEGAFCAHHTQAPLHYECSQGQGTVAEPESARHFPASSPATSEVVEALKALTAIGYAATTEAKAQMPDYNGRTIGEWVHAAREALRKAEAGRQPIAQGWLGYEAHPNHQIHAGICGVCQRIKKERDDHKKSRSSSNYVCNDTVYPTQVTFADGRVVTVQQEHEEGRYYLSVSPKSEYPKPCGICDGVIQSRDDLDWHGYGNCRDIPEPIMRQAADSKLTGSGYVAPAMPESQNAEVERRMTANIATLGAALGEQHAKLFAAESRLSAVREYVERQGELHLLPIAMRKLLTDILDLLSGKAR